jgi:hypothetical protein
LANAESSGAKTVSDGAELRVDTIPATVAAVTTVFSCGTAAAATATGSFDAAVSCAGVTPSEAHPEPHGRPALAAELLAAEEVSAELALLLVAGAAADVVFDDEEELELHAVSAAAAAASTPTDTAIPRRMITAIPSEFGSSQVGTTSPPSPFHRHGAMIRARMLPVRNRGMPFVVISGGSLPRRTDLAF